MAERYDSKHEVADLTCAVMSAKTFMRISDLGNGHGGPPDRYICVRDDGAGKPDSRRVDLVDGDYREVVARLCGGCNGLVNGVLDCAANAKALSAPDGVDEPSVRLRKVCSGRAMKKLNSAIECEPEPK